MASSSPESPDCPSERSTFRLSRVSLRRAHARRIVIALRLVAAAVAIASVVTIWHVMAALPWQIDCLVAAILTMAWAFRFERGGGER